MRTLRKLLLIGVALLLVVVVIGWNRRWFANEPAYKGKTVTEWLDSMALVDGLRKRDRGGDSQFLTARSSAEVTNDPALRALVAMGAKAVPVLEMRLSEPIQQDLGMTPWEKAQSGAVEAWQKISQPSGTRTPWRPRRFNSYQDARNTAAALGMLALGTNAGAGVTRLLEVQVERQSPFTAFMMASRGLPDKHDEIVAGITESLQNTNAIHRKKAATLTRTFPEDFQKWKGVLLTLARHPEEESSPEEEVREAALWALVTTIPKDDEIIQLAQEILANTNNPPHLRALAGSGLQFAGEKAVFTLPVMRQALISETNSFFQSEVRRAIKSLEKLASDRTNAEAGIQEKK